MRNQSYRPSRHDREFSRDFHDRDDEWRGYEGRGYEGRGGRDSDDYSDDRRGRREDRGAAWQSWRGGEDDDYRDRAYDAPGDFGGYEMARGRSEADFGQGSGRERAGSGWRDRGERRMGREDAGSPFGGNMRGNTGGAHHGKGPKGYTRSDERLREDVCDRLMADEWLDPSDIEVSVKKGEVTLQGHVDSRDARRRAEDCALDVIGVTHAQNNLRIQAAGDRNSISAQN